MATHLVTIVLPILNFYFLITGQRMLSNFIFVGQFHPFGQESMTILVPNVQTKSSTSIRKCFTIMPLYIPKNENSHVIFVITLLVIQIWSEDTIETCIKHKFTNVKNVTTIVNLESSLETTGLVSH